jgi:hypothetical protein
MTHLLQYDRAAEKTQNGGMHRQQGDLISVLSFSKSGNKL